MKFKQSLAAFVAALLVPACFSIAQVAPPIVYPDSENNILVVTLHDGDSLLPKLTQVVTAYRIRSGLILANIGQLRNFTLGYYDVSIRTVVPKKYTGPYDLATTQGVIARGTNGLPSIDIVSICDSTNTSPRGTNMTNKTVGGHILGGIVSMCNVIFIRRLDSMKFTREFHRENGFWDFDLAIVPPEPLNKEIGSTGDNLLQYYNKAVTGHPDLFGANFNAPVFDVAGRRIKRLYNGRMEKAAPGLYVMPQKAGKKGILIKK